MLHSHIMYLIIILLCLTIAYIIFFVSERRIVGEENVDLKSVILYIPRMVSNKNMVTLFLYLLGVRTFEFFCNEVISYNMISCGISKDTIVVTDSITFPLGVATAFICHKFLKKGYLIRTAHLMTGCLFLMSISKFIMVNYLL